MKRGLSGGCRRRGAAAETADPLDLLVVGGGINGAGIARDAAGRGLRVALCEAGDLAGGTSQTSSKLIHGGLRYLEHLEVRLVRQSLRERERLLRNAPHLVRPLAFVLPHTPELRPAWMIRLGLFLYDVLGGASHLPASRALDLSCHPGATVLASAAHPRRGFLYWDCATDDARLVVATAMDAAARGCEVWVRTRCTAARRDGDLWSATLDGAGSPLAIRARALVNAAGPWAVRFLDGVDGVTTARSLRPVKGSHIVAPRLYDGDHAFLLQNDDGRVVFVIPFEEDFTLVGTTEVDFDGDPTAAACSPDEAAYLCAAVCRHLDAAVTPADVVWSFAGVRPLVDDGRGQAGAVGRDYAFELDRRGPPLLTVLGGKLTTFRRLAEQAVDRLRPFLPGMGPAWTARAPLAGGAIPELPAFQRQAQAAHPHLPAHLVSQLARRHGDNLAALLDGVRTVADLGRHFGADLYEREVEWFAAREWARTAGDVLWRRTKAGLRLDRDQRTRLEDFVAGLACRGEMTCRRRVPAPCLRPGGPRPSG